MEDRYSVSLRVKRPVRFPEEPTEFLLLLRNHLDVDLPTDLPSAWWIRVRLFLTGPDGTVHDLKPFPGAPDSQQLVMFEGAELAYPFSLERYAPRSGPGWYSLEGRLGPMPIPAVQWFAEEAGSAEVAWPSCLANGAPDVIPCWELVRGHKLTCLFRRAVMHSEVPGDTALRVGLPLRIAEVEDGARGLTAMASPFEEPPPPTQWIGWLAGDRVYLGIESPSFASASCELPNAPLRILPRLLPRNNGADTFVLSAGGDELWRVHATAPTLSKAPVQQDEEDDDYVPPPPQLVIAPLQLDAQWTLPGSFVKGAVARGLGDAEHTTGVVLTAPDSSGIRIAYRVLEMDGEQAWNTIEIPEAMPIGSADPVLALDQRGFGYAAALFRRPSESDPHGRLQIACMAFAADGKPVLTEGVGVVDLGPLPEEPLDASLSFYFNGNPTELRCDWCFLLPGKRCMVARGKVRHTLTLAFEPMSQITIFSSEEASGIPIFTPDGFLQFVGF